MPISSRDYPRAPASFAAVGAVQLSFFGSCISTRFSAVFLLAIAAVPAIPFVVNGGFPMSRESAAFFLGTISFALSVVLWQHTRWRKGNAYFLSLPVERRLHTGARSLAGLPPLIAVGCALLMLALAGRDPDGVPLHGWLAPLVGATAFYLFFAGLDAGARHPGRWATFLWIPLVARRLGPTAEGAITPILESVFVLFLGSEVTGVDGSEVISAVGAGRWLMTSGVALAVGLATFLLAARRRQED